MRTKMAVKSIRMSEVGHTGTDDVSEPCVGCQR